MEVLDQLTMKEVYDELQYAELLIEKGRLIEAFILIDPIGIQLDNERSRMQESNIQIHWNSQLSRNISYYKTLHHRLMKVMSMEL